jgi:nucleoside-diphosphate-sugar epimerase
VGSAVARDAIARGLRVSALTRNAAKAVLLREAGVETVVADLAGDDWHDQVPATPDLALNCVSSGGGGDAGYRRSYAAGMESIVAWAKRRGPVGTLVYTSSTSVYPQGGGAVVDESAANDANTERGLILLEAEARLRAAGETALSSTGAAEPACWERWFILRLAGIYGPTRQHLVEQVRKGEMSGIGSHHLNLIHRDDIVTAVWACFTAPAAVRNEICNVADDGAATKAEMAAWLAARLGLPPPRFTGEPAEGRRAVTPDRVIANAKLKKVLGWQPQFPTFREGLGAVLPGSFDR